MTPAEAAKLARDKATLARRELEVEPREPLAGQASFLDGDRRHGWDLVVSRRLTAAQRAAIDERAKVEAEVRRGKPAGAKGKGKRKGKTDA